MAIYHPPNQKSDRIPKINPIKQKGINENLIPIAIFPEQKFTNPWRVVIVETLKSLTVLPDNLLHQQNFSFCHTAIFNRVFRQPINVSHHPPAKKKQTGIVPKTWLKACFAWRKKI